MGARGEWVFRGQFLVVSQAERLKSSKLKVEKKKEKRDGNTEVTLLRRASRERNTEGTELRKRREKCK